MRLEQLEREPLLHFVVETDGAGACAGASVIISCRTFPGSLLRVGGGRATWLTVPGHYAAFTKQERCIAVSAIRFRQVHCH